MHSEESPAIHFLRTRSNDYSVRSTHEPAVRKQIEDLGGLKNLKYVGNPVDCRRVVLGVMEAFYILGYINIYVFLTSLLIGWIFCMRLLLTLYRRL